MTPWAERLVLILIPPGDWRDTVVGDLREEWVEHLRRGPWRARAWLWREVLGLACSGVSHLGRRRIVLQGVALPGLVVLAAFAATAVVLPRTLLVKDLAIPTVVSPAAQVAVPPTMTQDWFNFDRWGLPAPPRRIITLRPAAPAQ